MNLEIAGNVQGFKQQDGILTIKTAEAEARVYIYSPTIIRVSISKNFNPDDPSFAVIRQPLADFDFDESSANIDITTPALKLSIQKSPLRFNFFTAAGISLSEDDARFGTNWQGERVICYRRLFEGERFIGLGEKTGNLDRRSAAYVNWNTDAPNHTPESDPLYKTFPFFIGLHSGLTYGLFLDNTHKSYFDFGASTDEETSWFGADGGDLNYYFFGAQGVAKIIEDYTWLTGRMEMPPLWSLGYQQCRWSYMSADEVLNIAQTFRKKQIPADVMYCDIDYMDDFKIFTWNRKTFSKPKQMLDKLKAMDFRLVTIVDPGIKVEEGYKEYDEGIEQDYFGKYPDGENYTGYVWPGRCHFPDFFREEVREWWGAAFTALTQPGVEGFWNDMNEPAAWGQNIPWIVKFGDKFMPEVRNAYGMQMARATYDGTRKIMGNKRPFVLTRAAYSGTQRYSAVWTGDNTGTDAHMLLGQRLVNSLGITGMSFVGVDIGGFSGNPTPELMVRWNSLGVYTPMFRNHAIQGSKMREPWEWGKGNEQIIKKDIEQRYKLLPYLYSSFYQSIQTGLPVSRTLAIEHSFDGNVFDERFQNEFMFGDAMLVAPVESTKLTEDVYLPKGSWYRLSSDKFYEGEQIVNVQAPLTDLPVFVKAGGIIPMQSVVQSTNEKGDGILQVHVWNGREANSFIYYEDDGVSYDYEQGVYYKRVISFNPIEKSLSLSSVEGSFKSRFTQLKFVLHGFDGVKLQEEIIENKSGEIEVKL
ncbi:glycoside hydrolase family 31 protein [Mucilaginibacter gossypii]|uniref:glycoside hydrolase family 31 protein n=1 Tax=Mucilaginibacter gossypii TaxID=551996 RepID=UPI000DCC5010|nr:MULTISPECIES: glycoside hydrolase family 31 protein [Mucilaginibacter]QTE36808.1 glycoside hydrolase family 31 protein [Mucilaginibacter gossypii]RAV59189.1 glycoside hydrolase family 31 [Mucilaginibacter rubeus]